MWDELTPSAISALRTAKARARESRRAVDGSSGVPAAYATTLKLGSAPAGDACTRSWMAAALAGLRSAWPPPNVTRNPPPLWLAELFAVSEIGGGGGGVACAGGGGGAIGASATLDGGAVGSVAAGGVGVAADGAGFAAAEAGGGAEGVGL